MVWGGSPTSLDLTPVSFASWDRSLVLRVKTQVFQIQVHDFNTARALFADVRSVRAILQTYHEK